MGWNWSGPRGVRVAACGTDTFKRFARFATYAVLPIEAGKAAVIGNVAKAFMATASACTGGAPAGTLLLECCKRTLHTIGFRDLGFRVKMA